MGLGLFGRCCFQPTIHLDDQEVERIMKTNHHQPFDDESTTHSGGLTSTATTAQIHEFDVLTGRDRLAHSHSGNRYFRLLCATHKLAYQDAKRRRFKTEIIQQIVAAVKERDGRFLTLDESSPGAIAWTEMDAAAVHQKVSHALRSGKKASSGSVSASSSSLASSLSSPNVSRPGSGSATPDAGATAAVSRSFQRLSIRQSVAEAQALFSQSLPNLNFTDGELLFERLCAEGERRRQADPDIAKVGDNDLDDDDDDDGSSSSSSGSSRHSTTDDGPGGDSETETDGNHTAGVNDDHCNREEDDETYLCDVLLLSGQEESTSTSSATFYTIDGKKAEF